MFQGNRFVYTPNIKTTLWNATPIPGLVNRCKTYATDFETDIKKGESIIFSASWHMKESADKGDHSSMRSFKIRTTLFLVLMILNSIGNAQNRVSSAGGRAAQYFLGNQDQVLMPVNVWGFVNMPGQYMVPLETDLVSLLSWAGGPREDARIKRIRVVRSTAEGDSSMVIDVDVKSFVDTGNLQQNPLLLPGDTVVVSGTTFYLVTKVFELGFRIAMIVQAVYLAQWYSRRN